MDMGYMDSANISDTHRYVKEIKTKMNSNHQQILELFSEMMTEIKLLRQEIKDLKSERETKKKI